DPAPRDRARGLDRLRPAQVALHPDRGRVRPGPGPGGASPTVLAARDVPGVVRPRCHFRAVRLPRSGAAAHAQLPGAEGVDVAKGAWDRDLRPPDRTERAPGAVPGRADPERAAAGAAGTGPAQHRVLPVRGGEWYGPGRLRG